MLAPTPVLRPSPLDIGGLFSGAFEALKRRFGLLVLITLLPTLFAIAVIAIGSAMLVSSFVAVTAGSRIQITAVLVAGLTVLVVGSLLSVLVQLKSYGMLSLAAYEIAQGQRPDFRGLLARSRGFLPRMASVIAIGIGAFAAVSVLFVAFIASTSAVASSSGGRGSGAAALAVIAFLVAGLAIVPLGLFLTTKLLYTLPAVALEGLNGLEAMARSWRLTRGAFWRTLGYYILGSLVVGAISYVVGLISQVALLPLGFALPSDSSDAGQFAVMLVGLLPALLLVLALRLLVQVVTYPFLQAYVTYMFIDQVRRSELPSTPSYGYQGGPGYYAAPGQYYAQPQQGYPAQWQPDPGHGWQPEPGPMAPGQADPSQRWDAPPNPSQQNRDDPTQDDQPPGPGPELH